MSTAHGDLPSACHSPYCTKEVRSEDETFGLARFGHRSQNIWALQAFNIILNSWEGEHSSIPVNCCKRCLFAAHDKNKKKLAARNTQTNHCIHYLPHPCTWKAWNLSIGIISSSRLNSPSGNLLLRNPCDGVPGQADQAPRLAGSGLPGSLQHSAFRLSRENPSCKVPARVVS